jgi:hypothetical protein
MHGATIKKKYGSMVWWQRVRYNVSKTELSKLQRLACLAITGAIHMTPTAGMEVLLGLQPLHVATEAGAQPGAYRLMCTQQWRLNLITSVTPQKSQHMEHKPIL